MQFTLNIDDVKLPGISIARLMYNKALPMEWSAATETEPSVQIPNPNSVTTNEAYLQLILDNVTDSYYNQYSSSYRIPTGEWLQRWTVPEKKALRAMGAQDPQMAAWLDELDISPVVNVTINPSKDGVPVACAALEQMGVIAPGQAAARSAEILAFKV